MPVSTRAVVVMPTITAIYFCISWGCESPSPSPLKLVNPQGRAGGVICRTPCTQWTRRTHILCAHVRTTWHWLLYRRCCSLNGESLLLFCFSWPCPLHFHYHLKLCFPLLSWPSLLRFHNHQTWFLPIHLFLTSDFFLSIFHWWRCIEIETYRAWA